MTSTGCCQPPSLPGGLSSCPAETPPRSFSAKGITTNRKHPMQLNTKKVDYTVDAAGGLAPTARASAHIDQMQELRKVTTMIHAAYVGAVLVSLFKNHPWAEKATLRLETESVYDDAGGYFRSVSLGVRDVVARKGVDLPEEICDDQGAFDDDFAADKLECFMEDDTQDFAEVFMPDGSMGTEMLTIERTSVSDMLNEPSVSGRDAFVRLFPEHSDAVTSLIDRY